MYLARLILVALLLLPAIPASAQCSAGACGLGSARVVRAPVAAVKRVAGRIRERERKPVRRALGRLLGR